VDQRHAAVDQAVDAHLQHRGGTLRSAGRLRRGQHAAPRRDRPHFYRTHDGGKTWTEINTGIAGDAVANTIREDPAAAGLLFAGTDTQVWVSFDDGDHWQSLRHNMPAISVRDLQIKDDAKCRCADLIAGTHGRGFWILDDVTPLRQAAAAKAALAKNEPNKKKKRTTRPATRKGNDGGRGE
jgi:photosystem II stability/assembly factor-like uncharacterized protein